MSGLEIRILTCDEVDDGEVCCNEYGGEPSIPSLEALRKQAAGEGWTRPAGRDLCPSHSC